MLNSYVGNSKKFLMLQNFLYMFFLGRTGSPRFQILYNVKLGPSYLALTKGSFKNHTIFFWNFGGAAQQNIFLVQKNSEKIVVWLFSKRRSTHDEEKRQRKNSRKKTRKSPSNSIATVEHNVITPISYPWSEIYNSQYITLI